MLSVEVTSPTPELEGETGPESGIVSPGIEVPAGAAGGPDRSLHTFLHFCIECFLAFSSQLDGLQVASAHGAQTVHDIFNLRFDHENHARMPQSGVWAYQ